MQPRDPRVLLWIPLPPPYAGPEVASRHLADACVAKMPGTRIASATIRTGNLEKGRLDASGVLSFAKAYWRYLRALRGTEVVYLVAAANNVGCLRDAVLIATAKLTGRRIVLHLRGGRYGEYYDESGRAMRAVLRFAWGSAAVAIVQTPSLRHALAQAAPNVPIEVVPNALPSQVLQAKADYRTGSPQLLFVGHLSYSKGFYALMRAFQRLHAIHPNLRLACAGDLPRAERHMASFLPVGFRDAYLARIDAICDEITQFVTTHPAVSYRGIVSGAEKAELFASSDVFVLPSYTEGFSLAILEGMLAGLPIVATTVGGIPDIVRDRENGLLVSPGDDGALCDALESLITDEALRERLGRTNAREARDRYNLDRVADQLAAVLRGRQPIPA